MAKKIKFNLNGKKVEVLVDERDVLVDVLRHKFGLTGTKKACGTGDCGSCTILINGQTVRSCITFACMAEGKEVLTIEGLGDPENPHPIQKAFVEEGAVQCGFCIPGMVLTTKYLLDKNSNPTEKEIKEALSGNFCRCTGYTKIIQAVKTSAQWVNNKE